MKQIEAIDRLIVAAERLSQRVSFQGDAQIIALAVEEFADTLGETLRAHRHQIAAGGE